MWIVTFIPGNFGLYIQVAVLEKTCTSLITLVTTKNTVNVMTEEIVCTNYH